MYGRENVMATISFEVPDDVVSKQCGSPEEFGRALRLAAAMFWYQRGEISQERAARIAGLDCTDFLLALARERIDSFIVDFDELERELARG